MLGIKCNPSVDKLAFDPSSKCLVLLAHYCQSYISPFSDISPLLDDIQKMDQVIKTMPFDQKFTEIPNSKGVYFIREYSPDKMKSRPKSFKIPFY